jgi:hypothetical protein
MAMRVRVVLCTLAALGSLWSAPTAAQYMFLDVDSDGFPTANDVMVSGAENKIDIWLVSDETRDGTISSIRTFDGRKPSLTSYQFVLRAEGGTVKWGKFQNAISTMITPFETFQSETEFSAGYGGPTVLPPGRFRLGSLSFSVESGNPTIRIVPSSMTNARAMTAFGSMAAGRDGDYTLKFADESLPHPDRGDWREAVGLSPAVAGKAATISEPDRVLRFGSRVLRSIHGELQLAVTTTRQGSVRVLLFDVAGRLVRVIANERALEGGVHEYPVTGPSRSGQRIAAGIYYFRVEAPEGVRTGKVAIVR